MYQNMTIFCAIRLEWAEGKAPSIYEIYTNEDEKQNTDDIGIYVEQIIDTEADSEKPKPEQPEIPDSENLAINRPVEVSGTELDRDQKDFAVDGNRETRLEQQLHQRQIMHLKKHGSS